MTRWLIVTAQQRADLARVQAGLPVSAGRVVPCPLGHPDDAAQPHPDGLHFLNADAKHGVTGEFAAAWTAAIMDGLYTPEELMAWPEVEALPAPPYRPAVED